MPEDSARGYGSRWAALAGTASAAAGLLALAGWRIQATSLIQPATSVPPMVPNTAAGLTLCGFGLLLLVPHRPLRRGKPGVCRHRCAPGAPYINRVCLRSRPGHRPDVRSSQPSQPHCLLPAHVSADGYLLTAYHHWAHSDSHWAAPVRHGQRCLPPWPPR